MKLEPLLPLAKNGKECFLKDWSTLPHGALAEAVRENNGGNIGLRLDLYMVLDPDCPEAEKFVNELDANGEIPTTITYQTASGHTCRIYTPPPGRNHKSLKIKNGMDLELRTGSGMQCVIPPSYLSESKTGKPGKYQWIPGHSPDDIEPAEFPLELYERLQAMGKAGQTPPAPDTQGTGKPARLNFAEGHRDISIYTVALALRKSGMSEADILAAVEAIAVGCGFSAKEAAAKVKSAMKETPAERHLAQEIKDYIEYVTGSFSNAEIDRELGINSTVDKSNRRKVLFRLAKDEVIHRDPARNGFYFKPSDECEIIDPWQVEGEQEYPLIWPFNIHDYCFLSPQSVAVVAGAKDAGKTAMLLNLALMNFKQRITYFNSEMSKGELNLRLSKFDYSQESWKHVEWVANYNSQNVENLIRPDNLNIIDYLEEPEQVWTLGGQISRIRQKLKGGIAIIGLQKDRGKDVPRGGESTWHKARIVLNMDNGEAKLIVGKLWRMSGNNPKGKTWHYKLVHGCKIIIQ
jgi:hypothetical protein